MIKPLHAAKAPAAVPRGPMISDPQFQSLWAGLQAAMPQSAVARLLGLTGCRRGDGVSTVAANLAVIGAEHGARVLLVDADPSQPVLQQMFSVTPHPGLSDVMRGTELAECVQSTAHGPLWLLTAGSNPLELARANPDAWQHFLSQAKQDFEWVIVDLPPADELGGTLQVAGLLDGVALVIAAEGVRWEVAARVKNTLELSRAKLLGAVLNQRREHVPSWLYHRT